MKKHIITLIISDEQRDILVELLEKKANELDKNQTEVNEASKLMDNILNQIDEGKTIQL